jgi:hypothetical protein
MSSPSPAMKPTDDLKTYFYIQSLATGPDECAAYLQEVEQTHYTLRVADVYTGRPADFSDYGLPGWQWR